MRKFSIMMIILFFTLLVGCTNDQIKEVNIELPSDSINQVKMTGNNVNLDLEYPFDDNSNQIIEEIIIHVNSLTYVENVIDEGECDGGNAIRYHLYTNQQQHYELYDVSVSVNGECQSFLLIKKDDKILGYSKNGSSKLYDLFLSLMEL